MSVSLSTRVQQVKPSATLALAARAAELKAAGQDIISLVVGEPDFATPSHVKAAAIAAIENNFSYYTPVDGIPSLKQAIIRKLANDNQLSYAPEQILVSCGAKQAIYNLLQALLNPGDEVLIPAPYWVSYPDMVALAEGQAKIITTTPQQYFKINAEQLAHAITPKTRLLLLNSPSNPTGMAYSKQELSALAEVLLAHPQVVILSDEIYEHIYWGQAPLCNILNACPALYERTVVINGVSKSYAMTGWRIGYAAGPAKLIAAMKKIQSQSTSNPCSISQKAAEAALSGSQQCVSEMSAVFKQRHDRVLARLQAIPGISCLAADGAFYLFPDIREALRHLNLNSDVDFADYLLTKAKVAVVPGTEFGSPGYFRLSFATSTEILDDALNRISDVITSR